MEPRRPHGGAGCHSPSPTDGPALAVGACARRHQDEAVSEDAPTSLAVRRGARGAFARTSTSARARPHQLDRPGPGLLHTHRRSPNPGHVRRAFRTVAECAGLEAAAWTPRELRHSFVSRRVSRGCLHRGDHPPPRPSRHSGHGGGLSQAAPTGHHRGLRDHGPHHRPGAVTDGSHRRGHDLDRWSLTQSLSPRSARPNPHNTTAPDRRFRWSGAASCWWAILGLNQ